VKKLIVSCIIGCFIWATLFAEDPAATTTVTEESEQTPVAADDPSQPPEYIKRSPTKALFLGLLVPGAGDLYCRKYTKSVIFFTLGAALGYQMYRYYEEQQNSYDHYQLLLKAYGENTTDPEQMAAIKSAYSTYSADYETMQTYMYYYLINLAVSTLDGVVEAYLSDWHINGLHIKSEETKDSLSFFLSKEF